MYFIYSFWRMKMSVVVKQRLLELLQEQNQNFYELFNFFLDGNISCHLKQNKATELLRYELEHIGQSESSLPNEIEEFKRWYLNENTKVCLEYQDYLKKRQEGAQRQYFANIAQAFEFLIKVAPTKKVDGAWLYSVIKYWHDIEFHELILIYLEELGGGYEKSNHVCIYNNLLHSLGLEDFEYYLDDAYYHNAVVQLALAYAPPEFIPEIIGFNLGYEQLPLHLLISNYELKELGIDAKYFNLHITIDNLANGHAHKSLKVLEQVYKGFKNKDDFLNRVKQGYALNNLGISSTQIIKNLNTEHFVLQIFKKKAQMGQFIHNDQKVIACKTVNQWLGKPEQIADFIQTLINKKWIKLNAEPEESPFWKMIHYPDGKMYGVFTPAERRIIHDWIAGEVSTEALPTNLFKSADLNFHNADLSYLNVAEFDILKQQIAETSHSGLTLNTLIPFLAPHVHHSNIGLWSTQKYAAILFPYLDNTFK